MRLTYIPSDGYLKINGVECSNVLAPACGCPEELHAIQIYADGEIEVEWVDPEKGRCLGNACGCSGLPGGNSFIEALVKLHKDSLEKQKVEEERLLAEAEAQPEE